jgi:apolipoprotein N-acyltransferase
MKQKDAFFAALAGVLLVLIFPRLNLWVLAWLSLVPLLAAADGKQGAAGFKLGWLAGTLFHAGLVYWVTVSMTLYGKLPVAVSVPILLVFAAFLGLFTGLPVWGACFVQQRRGWSFALTFPFLWVAVEHLKSWFLTGFPWDILGYSQYRILPLIQIADITGVYGVSFLIVCVNCAVYGSVRRLMKKGPSPFAETAIAGLLLLAAAAYGAQKISAVNGAAAGQEVRVALVQPNISQDLKWDPAYLEQTLEKFKRLTLQTRADRPALVVWPESATPFFFQSEENYRAYVAAIVKELNGSHLLFGSPSWEKQAGGGLRYHNSAFLINPGQDIAGRYDKLHLVPYGEYVPLARFFPFIEKMVEGIGDFSPGESHGMPSLAGCRFGTVICYEIIFPDLVRQFALSGAQFIINITNDAWFGMTSAPYQHLAMTALRAVENRRFIARCANTGISAVIAPTGAIQQQTGLFTEAVLPATIYCRSDITVYARYGDLFAWCCWAFSLFCLVSACRRRQQS